VEYALIKESFSLNSKAKLRNLTYKDILDHFSFYPLIWSEGNIICISENVPSQHEITILKQQQTLSKILELLQNEELLRNYQEKIKEVEVNFCKEKECNWLIYKLADFFRSSPRKDCLFKDVQEEETNYRKSLVCPFDIRWSSLYNAVSRIIEVYKSYCHS